MRYRCTLDFVAVGPLEVMLASRLLQLLKAIRIHCYVDTISLLNIDNTVLIDLGLQFTRAGAVTLGE